MAVGDSGVPNYDTTEKKYDRRYTLHRYDGIRDTILSFLGSAELSAILEVGCGTGDWGRGIRGRTRAPARGGGRRPAGGRLSGVCEAPLGELIARLWNAGLWQIIKCDVI